MAELKGSKGYLLPEVIDPNDLLCLQVYIPNDVLYLAAFSGAYERLGTWQVWEKDGTTRASQAAQVWKDAIDYTRENGWIGGCMDCCDELIQAINNIKITVTGGCGCNPLTDYKFPPDWEDDTTSFPIPPPEETTPPEDTTANFCDMAHEAFQQMYEIIGGFAASLSEYEPYYSIAQLFNEIAIAAPVAGDIYEMVARWVLAAYNNLVSDSEAYLLEMKEDIICAIVSASSAEDAKNDVTAVIQAWPDVPFEVRQWLLSLYTGLTFNLVFDGTLGARTELIGSDCSYCSLFGITDDGWLYLPLSPSSVETIYNPNGAEDITVYLNKYHATWAAGGQSGGELRVVYDHVSALASVNLLEEDVDIGGILVHQSFSSSNSWRLRYMAGLNSTEASREMFPEGNVNYRDWWLIKRTGVLDTPSTQTPNLGSFLSSNPNSTTTSAQNLRTYADGVVNFNASLPAGSHLDFELWGVYKIL